jgi:hypothetical protein
VQPIRFRTAVLVFAALDVFALGACDRVRRTVQMEDPAPPPPADTTPVPKPPVVLNATPASAFADAAPDPATGSPYEQAVSYHSSGQVWLARLVLEKHALGSEAKARDTELLARLCAEQADEDCVHKCEARLGKKLKLALDGGVRLGGKGLPSAEPVQEETDAVKAQRMVLAGDHEGARQLLLPKLAEKKITEGELRILRAACEHQRDNMCVLACDGFKKRK